jgi:Glyceraldehyde 3-phosphate dehydrogenase, C-terminal domain
VHPSRWGSVADIVFVCSRPTTAEEVNEAFRHEAATARYKGILGVSEDPLRACPNRWCPSPLLEAGRVPAIGGIVGAHAADPSSPALRVAARVLTDQGWTAPPAGAGSCLVRHTIRPEKRG